MKWWGAYPSPRSWQGRRSWGSSRLPVVASWDHWVSKPPSTSQTDDPLSQSSWWGPACGKATIPPSLALQWSWQEAPKGRPNLLKKSSKRAFPSANPAIAIPTPPYLAPAASSPRQKEPPEGQAFMISCLRTVGSLYQWIQHQPPLTGAFHRPLVSTQHTGYPLLLFTVWLTE